MKMKVVLLLVCLVSISFFMFSCGDSASSENDNPVSDSDVIAVGNCGNGAVDTGEKCDTVGATAGIGCELINPRFFPETTAPCKSDCSDYDTTNCKMREASDKCGNGKLDTPPNGTEACEIGDTKDCSAFGAGYQPGSMAPCSKDCQTWNQAKCLKKGTDSCKQINICVKACADSACKQKCLDEGSDVGKAAYSAMAECSDKNCKGSADVDACLKEKCVTEYYNCYPSEKCGNGTIDTGEVCEKNQTVDCGTLEDGKYQPGQEALCNSSCTGYDTYTCIGKDQLTCIQVYECINACSDQACKDACLAKSYAASASVYNTMQECFKTNCAADQTEDCYNKNCKFQYDKCKTHASCGNKIIDKYELCEKSEQKDCGAVNPDKYESGTANAFCNANCTEWSTIGCYGFCSCAAVKACVDKCPDGQKTTDTACVDTCVGKGSKDGSGSYSAWRSCVKSCCATDNNGVKTCGFDSPDCINECSKNITCGSESNPKCI